MDLHNVIGLLPNQPVICKTITMESIPIIFVDLNNTDILERVRLNMAGALHDIEIKGIILEDGLELLLDDGQEFIVKGKAEFSIIENIWVAVIDWDQFTAN